MPKVIFGICRRGHYNLEGKVVNSSKYVIDQQFVRYEWNTIPWRKVEKFVFKLQKRIYQAAICNDKKKVHKLQRLLLNSISAKLLAVRKVTQDNRGKKTAGIDGKANLNHKERLQLAYSLNVREKAKPSKRVWIPKPGKPIEYRPLGILTISDRAKETLMKMALEPEWEVGFEPNMYGFRPGRSCHDAIEAIFNSLNWKTAYCLDADISGCFDNINQNALLEKLNTTPTFRRIIKGWLRAGVMENRKFESTKRGTIQGGTISPLLACVALNGLEQYIKETLWSELLQYRKMKCGVASSREAKSSLSVIFYADDFIIIHESKEIILKAKMIVEEWLKTIGLELKPSKTKISHTQNGEKPGFNFLGFSIRHYSTKNNKRGYKLLVKPSRESRKQHTLTIKHKIRGLRGSTQETVIRQLNPITRGWSKYYSSVVSNKTFRFIDSVMFRNIWKWAVYRHPTKGKYWIKNKYFKKYKNDNWRFMTNNKVLLIKHGDHAIKRHVKVKGTKSPYDGDWVYWGNRLRKIPDKLPRVIKLLKLQQGKCGHCQLWFKNDDILETHHIDRNRRNNMKKNLSLLHGHCHDELHRKCA
ncbi:MULTISPECIES: reverse transcriptase domain-containing protein [Wolbachia]|uniref:reverse transcriptase domain-containing protein n=1 Tax=Wolbachia TaxID=953 RepID=UPI001BDD223D|nr:MULTISPECIES: reverse transcriptase domain-containing protein [unclassified Wolbachia]URG39596.1 reverse transcriptase N-terminal domain-containing protein [Wolbachia endosymbiont of Ostrinia furnacalis]URG39988.1 reverse transcriptase N-terminal domain-containing protein [Wolbachia endosymbiont of Ostrinia furnacalis]URG40069.1 reverse transcriptase N-terminal domain-containing protein [Wolbachia endosymbiont of Ostrinia furnacalis]URG40078.1 reverse transcriptase N-terminal domain-containi